MSDAEKRDVSWQHRMLAELAGLDQALKHFPDDVRAAALTAQQARQHLPKIDDPMTQPWSVLD